MVQDVFNLQVLRPSVDSWNTELRSVCFGRASLLLSPTTQSWENLIVFPWRLGEGQGRAEYDTFKMLELWEEVSENGPLEGKGVLSESRNRRKAGTRNTRQDKEWRERMAEVCVETGLTGRETQTLPQWQDFGCQNSSGCSAIVKLSAFKKMEEITHSLCLWGETVIAVDFWIKYDWTWDFKGGRNAS